MEESNSNDLNWLLDDMITRTVGAQHAVVLSTDGLCVGRSCELSREDGEHLAAMASAFQSLARGVGRHFDGGQVQQTVVELDRMFLLVTEAGNGTCFALVAKEDADIGMVAYEMNLMAKKAYAHLAAAPRTPVPGNIL